MAETEKRMAGGYEITQSLRIGNREVVFGVNANSENPYFCGLYHEQFEIIQTREIYENCVVGDSYIEIVEQFAGYVQEQCQKVRAEYQSADNQLVLVEGGSGASANSRGTTCFCRNLYTGKSEHWRRYDVMGVVKPECLPDWDRQRAAEIREKEAEQKTRKVLASPER